MYSQKRFTVPARKMRYMSYRDNSQYITSYFGPTSLQIHSHNGLAEASLVAVRFFCLCLLELQLGPTVAKGARPSS